MSKVFLNLTVVYNRIRTESWGNILTVDFGHFGAFSTHPNVRLWLIADLLGLGDLRPLYPRKRTF